jgi:hypothetical protein
MFAAIKSKISCANPSTTRISPNSVLEKKCFTLFGFIFLFTPVVYVIAKQPGGGDEKTTWLLPT